MKGFIAIILFFVLALAGVKTGHLSVASSIAVPGQCAVQDDCFTHSHSVNECKALATWAASLKSAMPTH